jgi:hypothetical protein
MCEAIARGDKGMAIALAGADEKWAQRSEMIIRSMPSGRQFLAEVVSAQLLEECYFTENTRAMGAIIKRLSREGVIFATGDYRRARTSNGTLKTVWQRA